MSVVKHRLWPPIWRAITSPATWVFAAAWLAAVAILALRGYADGAAGAPVELLPILFFCWVTVLFTDDPPPRAKPVESARRLMVQVVAVLGVAVLALVTAASGLRIGPPQAPLAISDPLLELLLPLGVLLLLGARWRELGFGPGHRVALVLALWALPRLAYLAGSGAPVQPGKLLFHFLRNAFQNGPVEEFLFRGALQARLSLLLGGSWGLVLAALLFGLWHVWTNATLETHGDVIGAVCLGITGQAPFGLAFGVIFRRTRNLLASSVFHMVVDLP